MDTRVEGDQVVAPGSIHENGVTYEILSDIIDELPEPPTWLLDLENRASRTQIRATLFGAEGTRNTSLCSTAGFMRKQGATPEQIEASLWALNSTLESPLDESEVHDLAMGIDRYAPPTADEYSDRSLADRFAQLNAEKLARVPELGWLYYKDGRWIPDMKGLRAQELVKRFVTLIEVEANRRAVDLDAADAKTLLSLAKKVQSAAVIRNIEKLAASDPNLLHDVKDFDSKPYLFNVRNGVIDLRNGEMIAHDPRLFLTKQADVEYDPMAQCPLFDHFLDEVLGPKKAKFLLRALAYSMLDTGKEQLLFLLCGSGRNGKTTLINVFHDIFGDYAAVMDPSTLLKKSVQGISNDQARLLGIRTVFTSELPQGAVLDAALLKRLVGNETISVRFLYQESFEFEPRGVIFLASNHTPVIDGSDFALARRMCLLKFEYMVPADKIDPHLQSKLLNERSGILNRVLAELASYLKNGLQIPEEVEAATKDYVVESDVIEQFLSTCCALGSGRRIAASDLFSAYTVNRRAILTPIEG